MNPITEIHIRMTTGFEHGFRPCRAPVIEGMTGPVVGTPIGFGFDNDSRGTDAFYFGDQTFSDQFSGQRNHIRVLKNSKWNGLLLDLIHFL